MIWLGCGFAKSQDIAVRTTLDLNKEWGFTKAAYSPESVVADPKINWQAIDLPHTWNVADVMDDEPGYYRGACWYKKKISIPVAMQSKDLFLKFDGANQQTEVYVNGQKAGTHIGGYTAFQFKINKYVKWGNKAINEIAVKVDNSYNEAIPPLTADFTFYGGIYRSVSLLALSKTHFSNSDHSSKGVYISTPAVSAKAASLNVKGLISSKNVGKVLVKTTLYNLLNQPITNIQSAIKTGRAGDISFTQQMQINTPVLWTPEQPYLYKAVTEIKSATTGEVIDQITNSIGFRWFRFSADSGFFLNDKPYKLIGTSRHQDYQGMGNAVSQKLACKDVQLLKEMGGNFLRVAHYPQDQCVLDACDSLGILASVEIPVVNEITESEAFYQNCRNMQLEMIKQNFNHPSVIVWCCMNEVLLKPHFNNDKARQTLYFTHIKNLAQSLDSIARAEDKSRYTMIACHGDFDKYRNIGLTAIPMIVGWNLYSGWYGANMEELPHFLDRHHAVLPNKPMLITEYGADADNRIHSQQPQRFDKSVEYAVRFHEYYLQQVMQRPFVAGAIIWNLADFNSESREESMPHINTKGLLTWDRKPKEVYRFYQAALHGSIYQKIPWVDTANTDCSSLLPHQQFNIMLGAERRFYDDSLQEWWLPSSSFTKNGNGCKGGEPFILSNGTRLPYGSDKSIVATDRDPIYQTQQVGIQSYRLSVPDGKYELQLHFAELSTATAKTQVYNLAGESTSATAVQRVFDVYVNDSQMLSHFNIAKEYGTATAVVKTKTIATAGGQGIVITFKAIEGDPVLNALQVKRLN